MKKLLILNGIMGAGKSTFIKENKLEDFVLSSDELRIKMAGFDNRRWFVVDKCIIKDGAAILNAVDCAHNIEYKFTDKSLFDNVSKVVFCIEGKIVEDAEYVDASWSDRTFVFEVDL